MLPDPITIIFDGSNISMPRVNSAGDATVYQSNDGAYRLVITRHQTSDGWFTDAQLVKRTDDSDWADGYTPLFISESCGVGRNFARVGEADRTKLRTSVSGFLTAYADRLLAGEL
jgi:hypothetical protein